MSVILGEEALEIWRSGNYIYINKKLACKYYRKISVVKDEIIWNNKTYNINRIIASLKNSMIPYHEHKDTVEYYYRGENYSLLTEYSYNKESFTSVSISYEQALSFSECEIIFKIKIDPNVCCIPTGIEEELLIEYNVFWNYIGKEGDLHLVEILPYDPNQLSLTELIDTLLINDMSEKKDIDTSLINDVDHLYEIISDNMYFFNVGEKDIYTFEDFKDDVTYLRIYTDIFDLKLLYEYYLEKRKN